MIHTAGESCMALTFSRPAPVAIPATDPPENSATLIRFAQSVPVVAHNSAPRQKPTTNLCDATAPSKRSTWKFIQVMLKDQLFYTNF